MNRLAAGILHRDAHPKRGKMAVEDAGIMAFICRDWVVAIPVMGKTREERSQVSFQRTEVMFMQHLDRVPADRSVPRYFSDPTRVAETYSGCFPLLGWGNQRIEPIAHHRFLHILDRDVTGLEQQRFGGNILCIKSPQQHLGLKCAELRRKDTVLFQLVNQKRRCALHKLRQGLGRAICHPDDEVLVTLLEPRIPRPSGYLACSGVYTRKNLLSAIPARFRLAYQQAEEPGGKHTEEASSSYSPYLL